MRSAALPPTCDRRPRRDPQRLAVAPPRTAASSASAAACRPRSSRTRRSPSASASTTTGSCSAPASARAAAPRRRDRLDRPRGRRRPPRAGRRRRRRRRRRPRARRDDDAGRADARTPRRVVATALGADNAGAIDVGAACTGFLAALRARRRPDRDRPRRPRARDRRRAPDAHHRPRRPQHRRAVRRRRRRRRARRRRRGRDRPDRAGRGRRPRRPHHGAPTTSASCAMDGHRRLQARGQAHVRGDRRRRAPRAGLELDDIDLFVYHQANGRIIRAVGERLDLPPARVVDCIAHMATRRPPRSRCALAAARGRAPAPPATA